MDNQGKTDNQIDFSEKMVCYALIGIAVMIGVYAAVQTLSIVLAWMG